MFHVGSRLFLVEQTTSLTEGLAAAVDAAIAAAGLSRRQAAELAGIPTTTLHRRLTVPSPLLVTELEAIAKVTGTTVASLLENATRTPGAA